MTPISRRVAIAGLAAASIAPAPAQAATGFSSIDVDVGPLLARGLGAYAQNVARTLRNALDRAFAERRSPAGPRLLVRVDALSMQAYVGGENRFGAGGAIPNDSLDGEALVLGRRGEVLSRLPQLSVLPANSGGAWYDPASEGRRVEAIAQHYALWLARRLP